jgi:hypothetical protein
MGALGMTLVSGPASEGALLASCALVPVVAVALGLAVGAALPHDLEGVLVIIGVVGVQLSLSQSTWVNLLLPLDGPIQLAYRAGGQPADPIGPMLLHTLVSTVVLLTVAAAVWSRKVRVRHPRTVPRHPVAPAAARARAAVRVPVRSWQPVPVPVRSEPPPPRRPSAPWPRP